MINILIMQHIRKQIIPNLYEICSINDTSDKNDYFKCFNTINDGFYLNKKLLFIELVKIKPTINLTLGPYNDDIYKTILKSDAMCLKFIPEQYITLELCLFAISMNKKAIKYAPTKFHKSIIDKQSGLIQYLNNEHKTYELCHTAISNNGLIIQYIPESILTPELCNIAVLKDAFAIRYIPESFITQELYKTAIQQYGYILQYVPENKRTDELCRSAVQQDGMALQFVPKDKQTDELCEIAIRQSRYVCMLYFNNNQHKTCIKH